MPAPPPVLVHPLATFEARDGAAVPGRDGTVTTVRRPAAGDARATAFACFHREVGTHAARYAATILGPRRLDALDDVLQEAWIRAWRAWDRAEPERRRAWFLRIVRNCAIDLHRRHHPTEPLTETSPVTPVVDDIEDATIARVDADRTFAVLGRLPTVLREALWLREVMDLTYADIAALQGVPIGTVMSRLHAARTKAAKMIGANRGRR